LSRGGRLSPRFSSVFFSSVSAIAYSSNRG
jgi:hypothetical protein